MENNEKFIKAQSDLYANLMRDILGVKEHDERGRLPFPSDEEIEAMHEAQTDSEAYRNAH